MRTTSDYDMVDIELLRQVMERTNTAARERFRTDNTLAAWWPVSSDDEGCELLPGTQQELDMMQWVYEAAAFGLDEAISEVPTVNVPLGLDRFREWCHQVGEEEDSEFLGYVPPTDHGRHVWMSRVDRLVKLIAL